MSTRISARTTAAWKWSAPVAGIVFLVDLFVTGEIRGPASLVGPVFLLVGVGVFDSLLVRDLADEVVDHGDHLRIVRRGCKATVPMHSISAVRLSLNHRPRRIVLELAAPTPLGSEISFLPNAGPDGMSSPTRIGQSILRRASEQRASLSRSHSGCGVIQ